MQGNRPNRARNVPDAVVRKYPNADIAHGNKCCLCDYQEWLVDDNFDVDDIGEDTYGGSFDGLRYSPIDKLLVGQYICDNCINGNYAAIVTVTSPENDSEVMIPFNGDIINFEWHRVDHRNELPERTRTNLIKMVREICKGEPTHSISFFGNITIDGYRTHEAGMNVEWLLLRERISIEPENMPSNIHSIYIHRCATEYVYVREEDLANWVEIYGGTDTLTDTARKLIAMRAAQ